MRRLGLLLAVALLLCGCGSAAPADHPAELVAAEAVAPTLLPPSCTDADGLRLSDAAPEEVTGGMGTYWRVTSRVPCTLDGSPRVRLFTATGKALPFSYGDKPYDVLRGQGQPVPVGPHRYAVLGFSKYRCDETANPPSATVAHIALPVGTGSTPRLATASVQTFRGVPYCPGDDGNQKVEVTPTGTMDRNPPRTYAVNLRSSFGPGDHPTWGRADVDGDGRPDTVILEPRRYEPSLLVVHLADGKTVQAATDYSEPVRLQALGDLNGDGRSEILVATTALGADYHGVFADGITEVFRVVAGQLRPVMRGAKPWQLTFALDGEGGVYSGVVCQGATVTQVRAVVQGKVTRTTFRIEGDQAVLVSRTAGLATGSGQQYAVSPCPGMSSDGWAEPPAG